MNRIEVINDLIISRGYTNYLEIGVENPDNNFNHILAQHKDGVDPYVENPYHTKEMIEYFKSIVKHNVTSDEFFQSNEMKYDLIFIDGLHTESQCSKDIFNSMSSLRKNGCIVIHDTMPFDESFTTEENFDKGLNWTGDVWKCVLKLMMLKKYEIKTLNIDWGITIIEYHEDFENVTEKIIPKYASDIELDYKKDFVRLLKESQFKINPVEDYVSYFVCSYKSNYSISRLFECLLRQTDERWELVVVDDNTPEDFEHSVNLRHHIESLNCSKIRVYAKNPRSGGYIGNVKHFASTMCRGKLIAELDHDDLIVDEMTEILQKVSSHPKYKKCDFFYTDCVEVLKTGPFHDNIVTNKYNPGFGMGYGSYRTGFVSFPQFKQKVKCNINVQQNINPKTIRHIVGVPNHIRCWRKDFLMGIGGHDIMLPHADDYELMVRTFLNGLMCKIPVCGYIQMRDKESTQDIRNQSILAYTNAIAQHYNEKINKRFKQLKINDYVYDEINDDVSKAGLVKNAPIEIYANLVVSKEELGEMQIDID